MNAEEIAAVLAAHRIREDSSTCACGQRDLWSKSDWEQHVAAELSGGAK